MTIILILLGVVVLMLTAPIWLLLLRIVLGAGLYALAAFAAVIVFMENFL